ncbi:MAG: PhoH family protein [Spirochaetia bacterium]|jgi:PhoH-like ATPase|nr:PhoH family protein [Spirochaetia bacterium]
MNNELKNNEQKISDPKERKVFVIDTNVFVHKSDAILSFRDSDVIIPLSVLEELDKLKSFSDERGRNARHAVRLLDSISKHGDLSKGIKIDNGVIIKVFVEEPEDFPSSLIREKPDNKIIMTALALHREREKVFFVSKDINARVKAGALGLKAVDYEKQTVNIKDFYSGFKQYPREMFPEKFVTYEYVNKKGDSENSELGFECMPGADCISVVPWPEKLLNNQYVVFGTEDEEQLFGRFREGESGSGSGKIEIINPVDEPISAIKPLNERQKIAFDMLLNDNFSLVTLVGKAGTGKTLLALAAGLQKIIKEKKYTRVLVSRPVIPVGKDIGYLPGSKDEKMSHWMQPLFDNLSQISEAISDKQEQKNIEGMLKNKQIEIEALTYMRGRSLPNQYIIIDEAQNLSPHEIKTIVSRAGENTKIVLTGDPDQIDSPYLDASSNGLTYLVEAFKGQKLFAHIVLEKSERSRLSELAAKLL